MPLLCPASNEVQVHMLQLDVAHRSQGGHALERLRFSMRL
jgi:hypothetical protein